MMRRRTNKTKKTKTDPLSSTKEQKQSIRQK
jgi:hypothetical protein